MTPMYRAEIYKIITREMNRVYQIFRSRHRSFAKNGKVSIMGHSLGSVLVFDLLCSQPDPTIDIDKELEELEDEADDENDDNDYSSRLIRRKKDVKVLEQNEDVSPVDYGSEEDRVGFPVENFFALGSPIGVFLLLKGHTLGPRETSSQMKHYRIHRIRKRILREKIMTSTQHGDATWRYTSQTHPLVSRPLINGGFYNIYHRADMVAYRLEPLMTTSGKAVIAETPKDPALIPYNKGGLRGISLGAQRISSDIASRANSVFESIKAGFRSSTTLFLSQKEREQRRQQDRLAKGGVAMDISEEREMDGGFGYSKIRGLNPTGRVDWMLQEGVLENEYLSGLSVHMGYWQDVDVASFIIRECKHVDKSDFSYRS